MPIQGLRDTGNFVANAKPENWREGIMLLYPNGKAPLFALTSMMKSRTVNDSRYHWWEKEMQTRRLALNANLTTTNTTITVVSGALQLKEGDVLRVEQSDEQIRVTADPANDTTFQASRGWAGTTAAAVTYNGAGVNPNVLVIGSAYDEASLAPTGVSYDPTERSNRTQIFRDTLEATRRAMKTKLRTGDDVKEAKRECLELHSAGIERAMWLGKQSTGTLNGHPVTTMDGIINQMAAANIKVATTDYATGVTMEGLEKYMEEIFRYGSSEKMGFCGNRAALTIQQILRKNAAWQFSSGIKEYGMNVSRLVSPFGEIVFKTHPLFNQVLGGTTGGTAYHGMDSWMFVLDMEQLNYVVFDGGDTEYQPDLTPIGLDGMKSGYLTDCSIQLNHPKSHYLIKNLVQAKAD